MQQRTLLVYSDSPTAPTGFGTVMRNVLMRINDLFWDIQITGVNFYGQPHTLPVAIWPAAIAGDTDLYGRARFASRTLQDKSIDVLFLLQDHFTLSQPVPMPDGKVEPFIPGLLRRMREQQGAGERKPFRVIQYVPIDGDTLYPEWVAWMPEPGMVDAIVAYCEWGRAVLGDMLPHARIRVIPHGVDRGTFYPDPDLRAKVREKVFKAKDDELILLAINRNQPRKDMPRTMLVFREVLKRIPEAKLYCHCNPTDSLGHNLLLAQSNLRLPKESVAFPANFQEGIGLPVEALNGIYNGGDIMVTTARGEGWGLTVSDAMSVGVPVIAPDHTSFSELLSEGCGVLVPPEKHRVLSLYDNDQFRPLADVDAMADAIVALWEDRNARNTISVRARKRAEQLDWDKVCLGWRELFQEQLAQL